MSIRYIVRCCAGGCIVGSRMENDFGEPLTHSEADRIARDENRRSAANRERKQGPCFEFHVDKVQANPNAGIAPVYAKGRWTTP